MVDPAALQSAIVARLPERARWTVDDTVVDYDFSAARKGLRPVSELALDPAAVEPAWRGLLVFGDCDVAEGGGACPFLVLRAEDGAVFSLDVEAESPLSVLNSGVAQFIDCFLYLGAYLSRGAALPPDADARLDAIDPAAYPASEWKLLVEYASRSGPS